AAAPPPSRGPGARRRAGAGRPPRRFLPPLPRCGFTPPREMGIEILLTTQRSLAAATRSLLDRLTGPGFENIDAPEDGRVEVDCLDGESGEEWGLVAPETSAMETFTKIKEATTTVRVKIGLRSGHF